MPKQNIANPCTDNNCRGLFSIADREKFALITLITAFSVRFGTSIYVASLSYKIFRNASFISAITDTNTTGERTVYGEEMHSRFNREQSPPIIIGYETKTIAMVYLVFSVTYIFMFYKMSPLITVFLGSILVLVALRILLIPSAAGKYRAKWKAVLTGYHNPSLE